ncbi:hypothetical protein PV05_05974 [Exophiala xenobiotica]|uniref:CFEM domain-containing protein n=1 Tax=Exophiala xenobiotica TaxID=348802 RepID=A0A0D2FBI3_9EURO|nr:uncharacterized protein PV05_05974 [Exophiala xenobiotica]KIW57424.1 hypothetical protein PV05_05974 [Exophiala xenobiotica]
MIGTSSLLLLAALGFSFAAQAVAQDDVDQCALACIANVDGTNCSPSEWPCLCANDMYIERMNNCTIASCNATDQQDTFMAVAQLCAIFSVPLTVGPEATVSIPSSDLLFSTVAIPTQSTLPAVITSSTSGATPTSASETLQCFDDQLSSASFRVVFDSTTFLARRAHDKLVQCNGRIFGADEWFNSLQSALEDDGNLNRGVDKHPQVDVGVVVSERDNDIVSKRDAEIVGTEEAKSK